MTEPRRSATGPAGQLTEARLRRAGREFLQHLYAALRSLKLYPVQNTQVQRTLDDLDAHSRALLLAEPELELRIRGDLLYVNGTRLRLELENYASFSYVVNTLRACGAGALRAEPGVERREWQVLLSLLISASERNGAGDALADISGRLQGAGVTHLTLDPPFETEEMLEDEERRKEIAKRTYAQSVAVVKEVTNSVRAGRATSVRKVKRAVQAIVDQVLSDETSIVGLTTIRDYDEYTFTHSVNVCIFAVALGRKIGLTRLQLFDLGLCALLHDVGKARVPVEILNKSASLTDDEWRILQGHPWLGVLTLFGLRGYGEVPYRPMIVAHEHHMRDNLTGYPRVIRPRELSMFSKIVAVADGFDAATTRRAYQTVPIQPDQVLREMWENPRRGYDQTVVKAFINLIGIYPVGTCVILDSYEVGLVHAANPDAGLLNRPILRVVLDQHGVAQDPAPLVNLADRRADGTFHRSIIKVTDPAKYGIAVGDYFV